MISNFLLWQIAYTELYFTQKLWPDFSKEDFYEAIERVIAGLEKRSRVLNEKEKKILWCVADYTRRPLS